MKFLLFCNLLSFIAMKTIETGHQVLPSKQCIEYLEEKGTKLQIQRPDDATKSTSGLVYILSNGEVVLLPSHVKPSYPGIIFKDMTEYKKYADLDSFPIDKKDMTWLEANASNMKEFGINNQFFISILRKELNLQIPLD